MKIQLIAFCLMLLLVSCGNNSDFSDLLKTIKDDQKIETLPPGIRVISVNNQNFKIEEKAYEETYKNNTWIVYKVTPPQMMNTAVGKLSIGQFWYARPLDESEKYGPAYYVLAEDSTLIFDNQMEVNFKKGSPISYDKKDNFFVGLVAKPVGVPVIDGDLAFINGFVQLPNPTGGILASEYKYQYKNGSHLIFQEGGDFLVKDKQIVRGYVKSGKWVFADGSWANLNGPIRFYPNGNLEKFELIQGVLPGLDNVTRNWKSVKNYEYDSEENLLFVLEGKLAAPEKVMVPELDVELPTLDIKFAKSSYETRIEFISLLSPYQANLCVDYSKNTTEPHRKCYEFEFHNSFKFFGGFEFETVVKYNKDILWKISYNGSGIPWGATKDSKIASKLGYCKVVMQRWTSMLGKYEKANISNYSNESASKSCASSPDLLK